MKIISTIRRHWSTRAIVAAAAVALTTAVLFAAGSPRARADDAVAVKQAALPLLLLFPNTPSSDQDLQAMFSLRKTLRSHASFVVIAYDVDSPTILLAAKDAGHPEWATSPIDQDVDRLGLAQAIGAAFYAVVERDSRGRNVTVRMVAAGSPASTWTVDDHGDRDAESLAADAAAFDAGAAGSVPAPAPAQAMTPPPVQALGTAQPVQAAPTPVTTTAPAQAMAPPPVQAPATAQPVQTVAAPPPPAPVETAPPTVEAPPSPTPAQAAPAHVTVTVPAAASEGNEAPTITVPAAPAMQPASPDQEGAPASSSPAQAPASGVVAPTEDSDAIAEQLAQVQPLLAQGDAAVDRGEIAEAISDYRQAINGAPLSTVPRLRLAQAYLQGGFRDKAIDEAKRALEVAPDSVPVQEFLIHIDADQSTSEGTVALYEALVEKNPTDAGGHIGLGDAYWNNDALARAETEYKIAEHLSTPGDTRAARELARLYAVQNRFDDALQVVNQLGVDGYPVAVKIMQTRSEALLATLSTAREAFDAGKSSHEEFYDIAKTVSADAGGLSDFISKSKPPIDYKVSHLHRKLCADLIGQEADVLQQFIETSDGSLEDQAAKFEKDADTEMLTAHAAEEKLGLYRKEATQP